MPRADRPATGLSRGRGPDREVEAHRSSHRIDQRCRVVARPFLENPLHRFEGFDVRAGSPRTTTRSACFPFATVPIVSRRPRYAAPLYVAMWIASTGVKPASTRSSIPRWSAKPGMTPPLPVGSGPARSRPPAATKARSRRRSLLYAFSQSGPQEPSSISAPRGLVARAKLRREERDTAQVLLPLGDALLEHGERRGDGHVMGDEGPNERLQPRARRDRG